MLERMWSKGNTHPLLVGMQTCTTTLEIIVQFLRKLGINLHQDAAIPFLGTSPRDAQSYYKSICSAMFIAVLFLIARTQKQPRCSSMEKWIKKMWHIYTLEYYSVEEKKNQWHLEFYMQMDRIRKHYSEWGNPDPKRGIWYVLTHNRILAIVKGLWVYSLWS